MFIIYLAVYFLPSIIALARGNGAIRQIFWTNLLLGWTVLGWIVAFIWSVK